MPCKNKDGFATLSNLEAKKFYDRLGKKQDDQAYYEDPATNKIIEKAELEKANRVFEFGCGTGRFAQKILQDHLSSSANYHGVDLSSTMIQLSTSRLQEFTSRAKVEQTDGSPKINAPDSHFDRFISNYVLDLLSQKDVYTLMSEAHRVLAKDGKICLASLSCGTTWFSKTVISILSLVHKLNPSWIGGCRAINILDYLPKDKWSIQYVTSVTPVGVSSQVVIANKIEA